MKKSRNNGPISFPPPINSVPNSSKDIDTFPDTGKVIKISAVSSVEYKNPIFENLKHIGLYKRFINDIRTIKSQTTKLDRIKHDGDTKSLNDAELIEYINSNYLFEQRPMTDFDLRKSLTVYPEFAKAYTSGAIDLLSVVENEILEKIERDSSNENLELALKVVQTSQKLVEYATVKQVQGVNVNLGFSDTTNNTLTDLLDELKNIKEPDFDTPDEEEIEYDKHGAGEE